jgi:hypothetical protein
MSDALRRAEAETYYRLLGNAELHADIEWLSYLLADAGDQDPVSAEFVRVWVGDDLQLAAAEVARRERLLAAGHDVPDPLAGEYLAWRDLARELRERADIVRWLQIGGCRLERAGREWAGPCPLCGGEDRFRVWSAADGKRPGYWCRQCGLKGDVILAYRNFVEPGCSFFAAVRALAAELGLPTPDGETATPAGGGAGGPRRSFDSPQMAPLRGARGGNQLRPPVIRFEQGRMVPQAMDGNE